MGNFLWKAGAALAVAIVVLSVLSPDFGLSVTSFLWDMCAGIGIGWCAGGG